MRGVALTVALALAAALPACGGDDPGSTAQATAPAPSDTSAPQVEATAVAPTSELTSPSTVAPTNPAEAQAEPGPYPVGVTELDGGPSPITVFYPALDGSQEGREAATYHLGDWLPPGEAAKVAALAPFTMAAFADLPPADQDGGPYPLVLFSHGLAGYRLQSTFLTAHLASWGFVVVAVEHPYRNLSAVFGDLGAIADTLGTEQSPDVAQLLGAIDLVRSASDDPSHVLSGLAVDTDHVGAVGHSLGGFAVFNAARDPRVDSYVALAFPVGGTFVESTSPTTAPGPAPPDKPSMLIAGSADAIAPLPRVEAAYGSLPPPKGLAVIEGMTHLGFTDLCELTPEGTPDVLTTARAAGVAVPELVAVLFADGCDVTHTAARDVWPALSSLTTAHLRATLGVDPSALDFDQADLDAAFPKLQISYSADR